MKRTMTKINACHYPVLRNIAIGVALASLGVQAAHAATTYNVINLQTTIAGFVPVKINNTPLIVGNNGVSPTTNQFIYDPSSGVAANITTLPTGDTLGSAVDINLSGQVVGSVTLAGSTATAPLMNVFVRNLNGTAIDLGSFVGPKTYSTLEATAINDLGQVIGNSTATSLCDNRAFTGSISGGGLNQIDSLAGPNGWISSAGINNQGQIVGSSGTDLVGCTLAGGTEHAFATSASGVITDLQDPNMPSTPLDATGVSHSYSNALAINGNGLAVGRYAASYIGATGLYSSGQPIFHAVVWDTVKGGYTDMGSGSLASVLTDINAKGQVIGAQSTTAPTVTDPAPATYPVVGSVGTPRLTDLNTLVTLPTGFVITSAIDINDAGQILVKMINTTATTGNNTYYLLLNPVTTVTPTLPAAPTALTASAISSTQINLSWVDNAGTNETGQYLERCAGVGCTNFTQIATLAAGVVSYGDTALTASTSYSYRIRAHNAVGNSAYSNVATATTATAAPAAPTALASTSISRSKVTLSWADNSNNETKFLLERCRGLNCTSFSQIASFGANIKTYADSNLNRNTNYSYRVRAANAVGNSAYSNVLAVKTLP